MPRGPGRPAIGARIAVRLPPPLLEAIDRRARQDGTSRSAAVRTMLEGAIAPDERTGVDRSQIQRMLALSPAERIDHVTRAHRRLAPFRAVAHR